MWDYNNISYFSEAIMKYSKFIALIMSAIIICTTSMFIVSAASSTPDDAVISQSNEEYVPLYTKSPDSSFKDHSELSFSGRDYQLFYTQTTLLALVAGYLIIFKLMCLKTDEKMHRRKK